MIGSWKLHSRGDGETRVTLIIAKKPDFGSGRGPEYVSCSRIVSFSSATITTSASCIGFIVNGEELHYNFDSKRENLS